MIKSRANDKILHSSVECSSFEIEITKLFDARNAINNYK